MVSGSVISGAEAAPAELAKFLEPLVDAGVDLFDCSTRRFWEPEFAGSDLNLAGWTKKLTGAATMTVGSVGLNKSNWIDDESSSLSDAGLASLNPLMERLERGEFDLVAVGRMLIANPGWPNILRGGVTAAATDTETVTIPVDGGWAAK